MEVSEYKLKDLIRSTIIEVFQENQNTLFSIIDNYNKTKQKNQTQSIQLVPTTEYPTTWDDIIDKETRKTIITISTKEEADENLEVGITKSDDGIYDIVVDTDIITEEIAKKQVAKLSKIVEINYLLNFNPKHDDSTD